ncbi:gag-pol polyprotein [Cucumis melo var. makuwa]|uniref:Gag-pol polyprotein n=1 Tax=Cucumis melo var. makuwa TaxID=1194695 RepID=A0A5D3E1R1_CUCMM|nr:gag-pol polyprotein [Cucumis melo var. makuwa]
MRGISRRPDSKKMEWRVKEILKCSVAFTSIHMPNSKDWTCRVTFEDGVEGNVVGKGNISRTGARNLNEVHLVEGLSANLISISQLCNQGFMVNFSKDGCKVSNAKRRIVMTGSQLSDNFYHWDKNSKDLNCNLLGQMKECYGTNVLGT